MKKKVFFILSSFRAGGAERVFWLISQHLDKTFFDVSIVLLTAKNSFFDTNLDGVRVIDLNTTRASKSFFKLYSLIEKERPDAIFSTGGQINLLVGFTSLMVKVPTLIARPTNQDNSNFLSLKAKVLSLFGKQLYKKFDKVICQSNEIRTFIRDRQGIPSNKLVVIPNPVMFSGFTPRVSSHSDFKRLVVVARLTAQKGISRLLDIVSEMPPNYHLTIVGDGPLRDVLQQKIVFLNLTNRVKMLGLISNVLEVIAEHDLFVLPSYIEGFPNVVIEALSVGTPVISFEVGGISEILIDDFNGFIIKQNDLGHFKEKLLISSEKEWNREEIRKDICNKFSLEKIVKQYEKLI